MVCPQCGGPLRRARAVYCGQACQRAGARAMRVRERAERLAEALHLMRFGLRLDVVAARLGIQVETLLRTVQIGQATPGLLTDLDLQTLRRLVRADRQRTREDADARMSDQAREWRWTS